MDPGKIAPVAFLPPSEWSNDVMISYVAIDEVEGKC